jgi:hypothetical protein
MYVSVYTVSTLDYVNITLMSNLRAATDNSNVRTHPNEAVDQSTISNRVTGR